MFERRKSPPPEIGADNILRNDVEITFKTFLEGVYAGRSKPFREAAFRIGYGIFREVCLRANVLLGHVRALLGMEKVRYITGRPRGRRRRGAPAPTQVQMTLRLAF